MIRNRLVVGIKNSQLSEHLQLDLNLTLEKAKKMLYQREAVQQQQQSLKEGELDRVNAGKTWKEGELDRVNAGKTWKRGAKNSSCCGIEQHPQEKCPARDAICQHCQRKGHY